MILLLRGDPSMAQPDSWHNLEPSQPPQPPPLALPAGMGTQPNGVPCGPMGQMATNGCGYMAPNGCHQTLNGHQPMMGAQQPVIQAQQGQRPLSQAEFFWRNRCVTRLSMGTGGISDSCECDRGFAGYTIKVMGT